MLEEFNQILQNPVVMDAIQYVNLYAPYAILLASLYFSTKFVISFLKASFEVVKRVPRVVGWVAKQAWRGVKLVGRGVAAVGRGIKNSFKWLFGSPEDRVVWDDTKEDDDKEDTSGLVCWGYFNYDGQWLDDNHPNRDQYRDLGDKVRSQMKSPEHYLGLLKELYEGDQRKAGRGSVRPFTVAHSILPPLEERHRPARDLPKPQEVEEELNEKPEVFDALKQALDALNAYALNPAQAPTKRVVVQKKNVRAYRFVCRQVFSTFNPHAVLKINA